MPRPKIGDQVTVDQTTDDQTTDDQPTSGEALSGVIIEGPWLSTGDNPGKPVWKVDQTTVDQTTVDHGDWWLVYAVHPSFYMHQTSSDL